MFSQEVMSDVKFLDGTLVLVTGKSYKFNHKDVDTDDPEYLILEDETGYVHYIAYEAIAELIG